ncbi:MAG: hypothetical protein MHMPM18_001936 [Marteilia pararefringens]
MPAITVDGVEYPNFVTVKSFGCAKPPMASISQQLAPFFIPPKKVADEIAIKTKDYPNIRVVSYICIKADNTYVINVAESCPMLIIKELGSAKGRASAAKSVAAKGKKKKAAAPVETKEAYKHTGDLKISQIKKIAEKLVKDGKFQAKQLPQAMISCVGTCMSMHCTVEGKPPKEVIQLLRDGAYAC